MTDVNVYGGGPPHTLPPPDVVDESGHTEDAEHNRDFYRFDKNVPGPMPVNRPHPDFVHPTAPGEPLTNVDFDEITRHFAALAETVRLLTTRQPIPWEYRGPIFVRSTSGLTAYTDVVPAGEIWEVERVTVISGTAKIWDIYDSNLDDVSLVASSISTATKYIEDASPIIRLGAGSRLAIVNGTDASPSTPFSVRVQYRLVRLPHSPADSTMQPRMP